MEEIMSKCLIGYTGFVGSSLLRQTKFNFIYRSTNIHEIVDKEFDCVVCAGVSAKKWLANKQPEEDWKNINYLIDCLLRIQTNLFILISTVDVYKNPVNVYEDSTPYQEGLHPYGLNRLRLEYFVRETFPNSLIIRLVGLVGPGLRKNAIFDIHNENNVHLLNKKATYQFYPIVNLWHDITIALNNNLNLLHLTSEPIQLEEIALECFNFDLPDNEDITVPNYDVRSRYSSLFGSFDQNYQYTKREVLLAIRYYAQSEPRIGN